MKVNVSIRAARAAKKAVETFMGREGPAFEGWLRNLWKKNQQTILVENPPNHIWDFADGTMAVTFGKRNVKRSLAHHQGCQGTVYQYPVVATGTFREVIKTIPRLLPREQQEAAMAYYVEFCHLYVTNSPEYQKLAESFRSLPTGLDNPFYKGVCDAILMRFKEFGWL